MLGQSFLSGILGLWRHRFGISGYPEKMNPDSRDFRDFPLEIFPGFCLDFPGFLNSDPPGTRHFGVLQSVFFRDFIGIFRHF